MRAIGGFMCGFGVLLGAMWIARSLSFVLTGQVPPDIVQTGHPTGIVYALDLTLLVPALVLGGIWWWQRRPWSYVLGGAVLVKARTYGLALIVLAPFAARAGVSDAWELLPLWAVLEAGCLAATAAQFRNLRPWRIDPAHGDAGDRRRPPSCDRRAVQRSERRRIPEAQPRTERKHI
jgi:hypothetical protein